MTELSELLRRALECHRAGQMAEAERFHVRILALDPGNFPANHLLGTLRFQQGRSAEALALIDAALKARPDAADALANRGLVLNALGRRAEALASYDAALSIRPDYAKAWRERGLVLTLLERLDAAIDSFQTSLNFEADHGGALAGLGDALFKSHREEEALAAFTGALARAPDNPALLNRRGICAARLERHQEALEDFARAVALKADFAEAWNNHGGALRQLKQFEAALASFDKALAIRADYPQAWDNRGLVLSDLKRIEEALASHDRALALKPDFAEGHYNRANALAERMRLAEARAAYERAVALRPDHAAGWKALGAVLCETGHVEEGFAALTRAALLLASPAHPGVPVEPHTLRHDQEQRDYLESELAVIPAPGTLHLEGGARLAGAAVNCDKRAELERQWQSSNPQMVVIDDFLTPAALEGLRRFCWGSTIWRKVHEDGYLGAFPEHGIACPLLAQIAEETRQAFPTIFADHPLLYFWAFKYECRPKGIKVHADFAAINVNFWITPDEANLDPESGGLIVWDKAAPLDWEFGKYNGREPAIRDFLAHSGANGHAVPYRSNRAVVFDSDLFHETDRMCFREGYRNRRINITLLFGRRHESG